MPRPSSSGRRRFSSSFTGIAAQNIVGGADSPAGKQQLALEVVEGVAGLLARESRSTRR
jgi:hypothetical protein